MSLSKLEKDIEKFIFKKKRNVAFSGPGGTGKSYQIRRLKNLANSFSVNCDVTSTTGVSALSVGGVTIFRWSAIKIGKDPVMVIVGKIMNNKDILKRILSAKILVIDEVSMLGSKIFNLVSEVCQRVREEYDSPFGGLQIVLSFDFLQLPPINDDFAFTTDLWRELDLKYFKFEIPQRFPDIEHFELLKRCRIGQLTKKDVSKLKGRVTAYFDLMRKGGISKMEIKPTKIYSKKADVEKENMDELAKLPGDPVGYKARDTFVLLKKKKEKLLKKKKSKKEKKEEPVEIIEKSWLDKILDPVVQMKENIDHLLNPSNEGKKPDIIDKKDIDDYTEYFNTIVPPILFFKPGAQVMLTYNIDVEGGLVNGSRGVVISCDPDGLTVKFLSGLVIKIPFNKYEFEDNKMKVTRLQVPFILAYAISIHKSQGSSLDCAIVDLGPSIFASGMGYVALSRVRTLEGIYLTNFMEKKIYADENALIFEEEMDQIIINQAEEESEESDSDCNENEEGYIPDSRDEEEEELEYASENELDSKGEEILQFATDNEEDDNEQPGRQIEGR